jgi:hypothetical protein
MSHANFTGERTSLSYKTRNYSIHKLFVRIAFVGIERALSGVRIFTVVPRLVHCQSASAWLASIRRTDESFNVSNSK